mmetsp:Transcript_20222/g.20328  ORF Transcript_20222/g.20328 Transcript_20222/m.20328 type:complete len:162 (-) Transcript_20222:219-704(-)
MSNFEEAVMLFIDQEFGNSMESFLHNNTGMDFSLQTGKSSLNRDEYIYVVKCILKSFPDFMYDVYYMTTNKDGSLQAGVVERGTHTGDPFSLGESMEPVVGDGVYVENHPIIMTFSPSINNTNKLGKITIMPDPSRPVGMKSDFIGPEGLYRQLIEGVPVM